jgi:acetyl-CoA synthetase
MTTITTNRWPPIEASPRIAPLIGDYGQSRRTFDWATARSRCHGLPGGGLNIADEAVDRHACGDRGQVVALRCVGGRGETIELSYAELKRRTDRFASALRARGVGRGGVVATLLPAGPELYVTALGTLKNGSVYCPLFPSFGPGPVHQRLALGSVRLLVTTEGMFRRKVAPQRDDLPALQYVLLVGDRGAAGADLFDDAMAQAGPAGPVAPTRPDDPALLHFTSGTTGVPKGAVHVHEAVVAHRSSAALVLDLRPGDIYWCTADPGWVTGTTYGIIGPLTRGVTVIVDPGDFSPDRWYATLERERVSVLYTAPTAIRMLMRAGSSVAGRHDLSALRHVCSVGEPLNPEAVVWGLEAFGRPIHDTWWQTETGSIMIANFAGSPVRPGSMGREVPGIEAGILERGTDGRARVVDGRVTVIEDPNVDGELALRPGWPSMFRDYLGERARYDACFAGGWYLTGDVVRRDRDGYFWFVARADDVIKSAGHLIGPFEVESALMEHPAVAEAGVIGKPDPIAGEIVKAFVSLNPGYEPGADLAAELIAFGRRRLGSVAPRELAFDDDLPHTSSGKVMRRLLKARELGLPVGDVSTLEARG